MPDLLPCPFCGGDASLRRDPDTECEFRVTCDRCFNTTDDCAQVERAEADWNRRVYSGQPQPQSPCCHVAGCCAPVCGTLHSTARCARLGSTHEVRRFVCREHLAGEVLL